MGPVLGISGILCIILAAFLAYRLFKKRGSATGGANKLELRTKELRDLIKTTRTDFYKRKIEEDKADKLIREYEEELKLTTKQIAVLRGRYGKAEEKFSLLKPANIAILIAIVALLVLGLMLLSSTEPPSGDTTKQGEVTGDCTAMEKAEDRDKCYQGLAEQQAAGDPVAAISSCGIVGDSKIKDECYANVARNVFGLNASAGAEACGLVSDNGSRQSCYYDIILRDEKAIKKHPDLALEACMRIDEQGCYYNIARAVRTEDPYLALSACARIEDNSQRDSCIVDEVVWYVSNATLALEICSNNASESKRADCVKKTCDRQANATARFLMDNCCPMLSDGDAFECYKRAAITVAGNDTDLAIEACRTATALGPIYKNRARDCYESMMAALGDINEAVKVCEKVPDLTNCNDAIWSVFGPTLGICQSISSKNMRNKCIERLVQNAGSCEEVAEICEVAENRPSCYEQGLQNKNEMIESCPQKAIDICLEESQNSDNCLWTVANALKYSNPTMAKKACNEMEDENQKNSCRGNL